MSTILELKQVRSGYGDVEILHGVSLEVHEGQIVSILGPNGAGKTTLLKTVMGVIRASGGAISFAGTDVSRFLPDRILGLGLAYVPQGRSIFPWMTVRDNLKMGAYLVRDGGVVNERLDHVFKLFPRIKERENARSGVLSGGERQMLVIGRALMLNPRFIMLDEPSLGLDPRFLATTYQKIQELNRAGITIILVEQNVKKALEISNHVYVLETGRIVLRGSPQEISSRDEIQDAYLGGRAAPKA